ncbi:putative acetyltransferase [Pararhizobium capsulatum DSM 1112]|uniref:Acetyltransferase n=1 Tax=Pararhizobium capsulatum DSM 1112 TaxID=1121113 RepID=A0ABU0C0W7_9HYPH|nr:N-acetyltransferase [Pararhizobium capsulatum]MDQ0323813.1 putative acetyltransferase [Pararhizobium capsulatum DSM 1112]
MIIRPENPRDIPEIQKLITAAFEGAPHSDGTEAAIVDALRAAGALTKSLVAELDGVIVGYVAFSLIEIDRQSVEWYGLGPIAVRPDQQRRGVGVQLIEAGLDQIKALSARGCVVLGDPAYYCRFGFKTDSALKFPGVPQEYFQRLDFGDDELQGVVRYHSAFYGE